MPSFHRRLMSLIRRATGKLIVPLLATVFFTGCAHDPSYYMSMSEEKLCVDYYTFPALNIHQDSRHRAILDRNINCQMYAQQINHQRRQDKAIQDSLEYVRDNM